MDHLVVDFIQTTILHHQQSSTCLILPVVLLSEDVNSVIIVLLAFILNFIVSVQFLFVYLAQFEGC